MTSLQTREQMLAGLTVPTVAAQQMGWDDPAFRMEWNLNGEDALPSSPVSELVDREAHLRSRFNNAVAAWPDIAARVAAGQQFNEWEYASNGDDDEPDDLEYFIGIGPISNLFSFQSVEGQRKADLIASALKLAAFITSNPTTSTLTTLSTRNAELEREVKRLREAQFWQPIETAPKDTPEWVFLYVPGHGPARAIWRRKRRWWESFTSGREITMATHWRPLPAPPAALSTSPQGGENE